MQQQPRKYQRNAVRGKGLNIWIAPDLRARLDALAQEQHTSVSAVVIHIIKRFFGLVVDEDQEAA